MNWLKKVLFDANELTVSNWFLLQLQQKSKQSMISVILQNTINTFHLHNAHVASLLTFAFLLHRVKCKLIHGSVYLLYQIIKQADHSPESKKISRVYRTKLQT